MTMKKPVKPNEKTIAAAVAKRKTIQVRATKNLKSGGVDALNSQILDFAKANKVSPADVAFTFRGGYYGSSSYMWTKRQETVDEKTKRVEAQLNDTYRRNTYKYNREQETIKRERAQAEATLARLNVQAAPVHNVNVKCCTCKCK